jgi:hypothetical protein
MLIKNRKTPNKKDDFISLTPTYSCRKKIEDEQMPKKTILKL